MSPHRDDFMSYKGLSTPISVTIADGKRVNAVGRGDIKIVCHNGLIVKITNALHIPNLDRRLLSVHKLTERGLNTRFDLNGCSIFRDNDLLVRAQRQQNVYVLHSVQERAMFIEHNPAGSKWELWHARVGHANFDTYKSTQSATSGMPTIGATSECVCGGCAKGKMTVTSFPSASVTKTTRVLELIHSDVIGPMQTVSVGGARYVLTFVDDYSKHVSVYFLKTKAQVTTKFIEYKRVMENQCGAKIMCIRTDNGTEYVNKRFESVCRASGIIHQKSVPYSPQQNGVAERMNRTIIEKARCMLHYKAVPKKWWAEAVSTAAYLINRTTNSTTKTTTPYEICFRVRPDLEHLRVFGSIGYAHVDGSKRKKLDAKGFRCMFLNYAEHTKGYKVLNLETGKVEVSRSLRIDEREVGGVYEQETTRYYENDLHQRRMIDDEPDAFQVPVSSSEKNDEEMREPMDVDHDQDETAPVVENQPTAIEPLATGTSHGQYRGEDQTNAIVFHPGLNRRASDRYQSAIVPIRRDQASQPFVLPEASELPQTTLSLLDDRANNPVQDSIVVFNGPNSDRGSRHDCPPQKRMRRDDEGARKAEVAFYMSDVPRNYKEAIECDESKRWNDAIEAEFNAHKRNNTWTAVPRKPDMKVISTKWVFAKKRNEHGEVTRWKARLVALGFLQMYGVDFFETYAAVANMNSIRILLSVCCAIGYVIEQLDVDTAYLNAELEEEVYIEIPQGLYVDSKYVLKLNKALYGLKQAGNAWNKTIHKLIIDLGFKSCAGDMCIYVKQLGAEFVYVCLYVDDMIVAARKSDTVRDVKSAISSRFRIKDLGAVKHLLGMEIAYDMSSREMTITQTQYINTITERFNQANARDTMNPCDPSVKLSKANCPKDDEEKERMSKKPYRSLVGCLMYVAQCTRPDVAYAVTHLSRFMENPGQEHWLAAIKILRYLKTTSDYGINYKSSTQANAPIAYCDADWGNNLDDRRSVSGVAIVMNGGPIVYKSKYQNTVALSSAEAEYLALSVCAQEIVWVRVMLQDLGFKPEGATQVWEDNQGSIALAQNTGYHARTKHVDIRHHFIREKVANHEIKLDYIATEHQLADAFIKSLGTNGLSTYATDSTSLHEIAPRIGSEWEC